MNLKRMDSFPLMIAILPLLFLASSCTRSSDSETAQATEAKVENARSAISTMHLKRSGENLIRMTCAKLCDRKAMTCYEEQKTREPKALASIVNEVFKQWEKDLPKSMEDGAAVTSVEMQKFAVISAEGNCSGQIKVTDAKGRTGLYSAESTSSGQDL